MDALHIPWQYEPQGYHVSRRITGPAGLDFNVETFPYLPDFWLPKQKLHLEVKGSLTYLETLRLVDAAASLSSNDGSGCHDSGGYDMLVLGNIPKRDDLVSFWCPIRLHMHKGDLLFVPEVDLVHTDGSSCAPSPTGYRGYEYFVNDAGDATALGLITDWGPGLSESVIKEYFSGQLIRGALNNPKSSYLSALDAARSARFEHGESGSVL